MAKKFIKMKTIKKRATKKLKWGVAGCGKFTEESLIPALKLLRKSTLNSVFSNNAQRAKSIAEKFGVEEYFSNFEDFLSSDIDAVYIGSVNADHYEQVLKAAKAGKHILCEKPLAITSVQAEEMVNVCRENNVQFAVNYTYRFHPLMIIAKEIMDRQLLGKLVSINLNFNIDFPPGSNFRFNKDQSGGGALRDLGTHMIDLLRFFGGEIVSINGVIDNIVYTSEVDDFAAGIVKFEDSGYGYFNVSFNNKKAFNRMELNGHKGALRIEDLIGAKHSASKLTILLDGEAKKAFRKRGNKLLNLLRSVQGSFLKNETPLVTGYDGYINMKLMEELEAGHQLKQNNKNNF
ncbi:MAG: Gfo/Idh/MocA family oxidoreductase [Ignavibacteriaceae bacterium]|nr:Gfo/Idh/MocA family oxidoreductase [Ignavibacteriaceae bacterium]